MAEYHRVPVGWICGVPFALTSKKIIADLIRISAVCPRLQVLPNGQLATLTREDSKRLENKMMLRVELMDVECLDCEEHREERLDKAAGDLAGILTGVFGEGVKVARVKINEA